MQVKVLTVAAASAALLMACGDKRPSESAPAQVLAAPSQVALAQSIPLPTSPSTPISGVELEKRSLQQCTSTPVGIKPPTLAALEGLQEQLRCIENFLDSHQDTPHWPQAYADRSKAMQAAMKVIKALSDRPTSTDDSDMAKTQRVLLEREQLSKLKSENYYFAKRAIDEITISIHQVLFRELRDGGMRMGDPVAAINESNQSAKQTGVWESIIDESRENGQFVVRRWVTEKSPMFVVQGFGPVMANVKIDDSGLPNSGVFSQNCRVNLSVAGDHQSYDCEQFLSGELSYKAMSAMKKAIQQGMTRQAGAPA